MSSPEGSLFAGGAASSPAVASELEGADRFFEPVPAPKRALRAAAFSLSVVDVDGVVLDDAPKVANGDEVGNGDEVPADPKPPTLLPELPKPKAAPVPDGAFAASVCELLAEVLVLPDEPRARAVLRARRRDGAGGRRRAALRRRREQREVHIGLGAHRLACESMSAASEHQVRDGAQDVRRARVGAAIEPHVHRRRR